MLIATAASYSLTPVDHVGATSARHQETLMPPCASPAAVSPAAGLRTRLSGDGGELVPLPSGANAGRT